MSLDKAIKHGKERRKKYYRTRSSGCRNHGDCSVCQENRNYANKKREMESEERMNDERD